MTMTLSLLEKAKPVFDVSELDFIGLGDKSMGQKFNAIINFKVIEITRSFIVIRITGIYVIENRRLM